MQTILTIAGFDPSSGAGITADLAVIAAHGYFGTSAITALTVQSTLGVHSVHAVDPVLLAGTLNFLTSDLPPAGIKIGMLATEQNVRVVVDFLCRSRETGSKIPVVLDPVIASSSGNPLLSEPGVALMRKELLWHVDWVTPNLAELGLLDGREIHGREDLENAVFSLVHEYPDLGVAATGGHLDSADDFIVEPGGKAGEWQLGEKIESRATHGTGCAYSTALLCGLVADLDVFDAARNAKEFVIEGIRRAPPIGHGLGPMDLLFRLRERHA